MSRAPFLVGYWPFNPHLFRTQGAVAFGLAVRDFDAMFFFQGSHFLGIRLFFNSEFCKFLIEFALAPLPILLLTCGGGVVNDEPLYDLYPVGLYVVLGKHPHQLNLGGATDTDGRDAVRHCVPSHELNCKSKTYF